DVITVVECKAILEGSSIVLGEGDQVLPLNFDRLVAGNAGTLGGKAKVKSPPAQHREADWFQFASFFIPKSISEPWLGDLREKRIEMADKGYQRRAIEWATFGELVALILYGVIKKLFDILTPFKEH